MPVIAICSGKGGVGKTTVAVNLSVVLSKFGKTLVIDCDIALPNLHLLLGLDDPIVSILDVLKDLNYLKDAIYPLKVGPLGRLDVMPSSPSVKALEEIDFNKFGNIVEILKEEYDYIILDIAAGLSKYALIPMLNSDWLCLVINPEQASISDAHKVKKIADVSGIPVKGIVVNRYRGEKRMVEMAEKIIGVDTIGIIRDSKLIKKCWESRTPVVVKHPTAKVSKDFLILAKNVVGARIPVKPYGKLKFMLGW